MATIKENPFQRSNPFPIHQSMASFRPYQPSTTYYRPIATNVNPTYEPPQQNKYYYKQRQEHQTWKFRQDNCSKHRSFAQKPKIMYDNQKSSFQKQLNISRIRNRNQNRQEYKSQKTQNPFYRKNLVIGKMAESYVYVPQSTYEVKQQGGSPENNQLVNSRYTKYPPNQNITSVYNLISQKHLDDYNLPQQNSLKLIQGIYSRKSLENSHYEKEQDVKRYSRQRNLRQIVKFDRDSRQHSRHSQKSRQKIPQRMADYDAAPQKIVVKNKTFYRNPVEIY